MRYVDIPYPHCYISGLLSLQSVIMQKQSKKSYRHASDAQIWTHIFFVPALFISFYTMFELFLLLVVVVPLSIANNVNLERPGLLSRVEGLAAKTLFVYGVLQMLYKSYASVFVFNVICFVLTFSTFIVTLRLNLYHDQRSTWEILHPTGMHFVPALWATITSMYNQPFYF